MSSAEVEVSEEKSGWADSMAKILGTNKPKKKSEIILSRAKKDTQVKAKSIKETVPLEVSIETENQSHLISNDLDVEPPRAKKSKVDSSVSSGKVSAKAQRKLELESIRKIKEWENIKRILPDPSSPTEKARERELVKIATRGVVQLFNAVYIQQKSLRDELDHTSQSEFKKDKIFNQSKEIFDTSMKRSKKLTEKNRSNSKDKESIEIKEESEDDFEPTGTITFRSKASQAKMKSKTTRTTDKKAKGFPALQENYLMEANVDDWDSESDDDDK